MSKLIGLGGKLRSGKDTVADHLVDTYGWVKLNMSAPLHEALLTLDPQIPMKFRFGSSTWSYSYLVGRVGYTAAKENPEVRRLLQALGTEVGRNMFGENVWVDLAGKQIDKLLADGKSVAITGIRFPNEFEMITSRGGQTVWVDRTLVTAGQLAAHASETGVGAKDFQTVIDNNESLGALYDKVDRLLV